MVKIKYVIEPGSPTFLRLSIKKQIILRVFFYPPMIDVILIKGKKNNMDSHFWNFRVFNPLTPGAFCEKAISWTFWWL